MQSALSVSGRAWFGHEIAYYPVSAGRPIGVQSQDNRQSVESRSMVRIAFEVPNEIAPALRSAVEEIRNELGGRLEGPHRFTKEHALTRAAAAIGILAAVVNAKIPAGDPEYV